MEVYSVVPVALRQTHQPFFSSRCDWGRGLGRSLTLWIFQRRLRH